MLAKTTVARKRLPVEKMRRGVGYDVHQPRLEFGKRENRTSRTWYFSSLPEVTKIESLNIDGIFTANSKAKINNITSVIPEIPNNPKLLYIKVGGDVVREIEVINILSLKKDKFLLQIRNRKRQDGRGNPINNDQGGIIARHLWIRKIDGEYFVHFRDGVEKKVDFYDPQKIRQISSIHTFKRKETQRLLQVNHDASAKQREQAAAAIENVIVHYPNSHHRERLRTYFVFYFINDPYLLRKLDSYEKISKLIKEHISSEMCLAFPQKEEVVLDQLADALKNTQNIEELRAPLQLIDGFIRREKGNVDLFITNTLAVVINAVGDRDLLLARQYPFLRVVDEVPVRLRESYALVAFSQAIEEVQHNFNARYKQMVNVAENLPIHEKPDTFRISTINDCYFDGLVIGKGKDGREVSIRIRSEEVHEGSDAGKAINKLIIKVRNPSKYAHDVVTDTCYVVAFSNRNRMKVVDALSTLGIVEDEKRGVVRKKRFEMVVYGDPISDDFNIVVHADTCKSGVIHPSIDVVGWDVEVQGSSQELTELAIIYSLDLETIIIEKQMEYVLQARRNEQTRLALADQYFSGNQEEADDYYYNYPSW